jgi:zinc protease
MRFLRFWILQLAVVALLSGNLGHAFAQSVALDSPAAILGTLERYTLANGLRVVLNPLPNHPTVGVSVTYDAGSRDEVEGRSGMAHLFEHLMFQGSLNVAGGEHFRLVAARGGNPDGLASKEVTNYFTEIPAGELELVLWLEADRLFHLALSRQAFESQRDVVLEELRQRYDNKPFTRGELRLHELVFQRYWPYEHPALGYRRDIENSDYAWVKQFHENNYTPARAVLTVVGGFEVGVVRVWIEKYFSSASEGGPRTPAGQTRSAILPRQTSERLNVIEDHNAKTPGIFYGWRIPGARTADNRALELASVILTDSETSRLSERLVRDEQVARLVRSGTSGYADADVFHVFVELNRRSTVDAMQKGLEKALTELALGGPTPQELERARANLKVRWLHRMEKARSRAVDLGQAESIWGNAALLEDNYTAFDTVSAAQVRAAVLRYVVQGRRSIVEVYPPGWVRDVGPVIITATYIVKAGDNLTRIAQWHGTTPEAIAKQNGFGTSRRIVVGQRLLITANPSKIVKPVTHTVAKGETLIAIGKKYGVQAADIVSRNRLNPKKPIRPGQILQIPPRPKPSSDKPDASKADDKTSGSKVADKPGSSRTRDATPITTKDGGKTIKGGSKTTAADPPAKPLRTYVVKQGDSLSVIAAKYRVPVAALTRANGLSKKKPIRPGQKLVIPDSN